MLDLTILPPVGANLLWQAEVTDMQDSIHASGQDDHQSPLLLSQRVLHARLDFKSAAIQLFT